MAVNRRDAALAFLIGRDSGGHWLAVETHGLAGGYFSSARDALRFVRSDVHGSARIEWVDDVIDPFDRTCVDIACRCRRRETLS